MSNGGATVGREALMKQLGVTFEGNRNIYKTLGYKQTLCYDDYYGKYTRQDVAKRIVNAPAQATWRNPPAVIVDDDKESPLTLGFAKFAKQFALWQVIERLDKLAGVGQFAILLMGVNDGLSMEAPLGQGDLLYLQPYAQSDVAISEINKDPTSARFGWPEKYTITVTMQEPMQTAGITNVGVSSIAVIPNVISMVVHWSRIIHVAEDLLGSNYIGTPRLKGSYNLLDDLQKVVGGAAEMFWLAGNRGLHINIDQEAELTSEDAEQLADEVEEYMNNQQRVVRTKNVSIDNLGSDTADPKGTFDCIISLIAGTSQIPRRILLGSEVGQLASEQDRANWADRIVERRNSFAEPAILTPLIQRLVFIGVLKLPPASTVDAESGVITIIRHPYDIDISSIDFVWPDNFQLTPLEEAQTMAQKARAAINLSKHFAEFPLITQNEARAILGLNTPADETIARTPPTEEELAPDPPDAPNPNPVPSGTGDDDNPNN